MENKLYKPVTETFNVHENYASWKRKSLSSNTFLYVLENARSVAFFEVEVLRTQGKESSSGKKGWR